MKLTPQGIALIKSFEGCKLESYRDSAGILTIGFGHTGPDVKPHMHITQAQADELLLKDLHRFEDGVSALVTKDTTDNQFSAMVSLAFNIGLGHFRESSVLKFHNKGIHELAADSFAMWNKAGGRVVDGLVRRRAAEKKLYLEQ